jgi:hypothetical protein
MEITMKVLIVLTFGSLATFGVWKLARVAAPMRCWAPRKLLEVAALLNRMACILKYLFV